jgi:hypothetical protein
MRQVSQAHHTLKPLLFDEVALLTFRALSKCERSREIARVVDACVLQCNLSLSPTFRLRTKSCGLIGDVHDFNLLTHFKRHLTRSIHRATLSARDVFTVALCEHELMCKRDRKGCSKAAIYINFCEAAAQPLSYIFL